MHKINSLRVCIQAWTPAEYRAEAAKFVPSYMKQAASPQHVRASIIELHNDHAKVSISQTTQTRRPCVSGQYGGRENGGFICCRSGRKANEWMAKHAQLKIDKPKEDFERAFSWRDKGSLLSTSCVLQNSELRSVTREATVLESMLMLTQFDFTYLWTVNFKKYCQETKTHILHRQQEPHNLKNCSATLSMKIFVELALIFSRNSTQGKLREQNSSCALKLQRSLHKADVPECHLILVNDSRARVAMQSAEKSRMRWHTWAADRHGRRPTCRASEWMNVQSRRHWRSVKE